MRTPDVIVLTEVMTTEPDRRDHHPRQEQPNRIGWLALVLVLVGVTFAALLPFVWTLVVVALWGLGGSGSNK
jgi:hypothetical protein